MGTDERKEEEYENRVEIINDIDWNRGWNWKDFGPHKVWLDEI